jgi:hypothetical protein
MLLPEALFALFMTGCWLYCLTDAILTPAQECRGLPKQAWIAVIAATFIVGAFVWLIVRRPVRDSGRVLTPVPRWDEGETGSQLWTGTDGAATRRPGGDGTVTGHPSAPRGPDDDPEFLRVLGQTIRRNPPVS